MERGKIIDTEYNLGHSHRPNGIWFGARYMMWFGRPYNQYIEKEKLKSFSNCYENIEWDNEVIRIRLYENLWDYNKIPNGGTRLTKSCFDDQNNNVPKDKATKVKYVSFQKKENCWTQEKKVCDGQPRRQAEFARSI